MSMPEQERRVDPSDGKAYTLPEVLEMYRQQYEVSQIRLYWFHEMKPELRFDVGDRVLCNMGERRLVGVVKMKDVCNDGDHGEGHGDHGEKIAYVVEPDTIPGSESKKMISVWYDEDEVVCRERCFHESELWLTKWAAPIISESQRKPLRFSPDEIVGIRIWDTDDGFEQWVFGRVLEIWPSLPEPVQEGFLQSADAVPYKVDVHGHGIFYCHRDDHTLLRRPENVPRTPGKRITPRFEPRKLPNGNMVMFDNLTLHNTITQPDSDKDDRAPADHNDKTLHNITQRDSDKDDRAAADHNDKTLHNTITQRDSDKDDRVAADHNDKTLHNTITQRDGDKDDRAAADYDDNHEIIRASELGGYHEIVRASELGA